MKKLAKKTATRRCLGKSILMGSFVSLAGCSGFLYYRIFSSSWSQSASTLWMMSQMEAMLAEMPDFTTGRVNASAGPPRRISQVPSSSQIMNEEQLANEFYKHHLERMEALINESTALDWLKLWSSIQI